MSQPCYLRKATKCVSIPHGHNLRQLPNGHNLRQLPNGHKSQRLPDDQELRRLIPSVGWSFWGL